MASRVRWSLTIELTASTIGLAIYRPLLRRGTGGTGGMAGVAAPRSPGTAGVAGVAPSVAGPAWVRGVGPWGGGPGWGGRGGGGRFGSWLWPAGPPRPCLGGHVRRRRPTGQAVAEGLLGRAVRRQQL